MTPDAMYQENEELRNALKRLHRRIREQRAEILDLRARLRSCKDLQHTGVNTTGFLKLLEERNLELEQWKATAEDLALAITDCLELTQETYDESLAPVAEWIGHIREAADQTSVPILTEVIYNIATMHFNAKKKAYEKMQKRFALTDTNSQDSGAPHNPLVILMKIVANVETATINHHTVGLLAQAHGFANDPRFVCFQILEECWVFGEPSMATLGKLKSEWIADNLPSPPARLETVQNGLRVTQQLIIEDLSRLKYYSVYGVADSAIRTFQSWRNAIEETAFTKPILFNASAQPMP
jgi:hypothetical protein